MGLFEQGLEIIFHGLALLPFLPMSPGDFKFQNKRSFISLRAALLLIGGGMGLLCGYFLDMAFRMEEVGYFAMLFICGGAGLGLSYVIEEKKSQESATAYN